MFFFKKKFIQKKCINGCDLFEDNNNFSYWENNEVTSDEKNIVSYLDKNNLIKNKNILHIGVGNSYIAKNLNEFNFIEGITISKNELTSGLKLKIKNYNIIFKNKYSAGDLIKNKKKFYDIIIDNNLKSFACCSKSFDDLIKKYNKYLKDTGFIITSSKGMNWTRIVKPVYSFSFKKFFHMKLKEFDGPAENIMNINDCKKLCIEHKMDMYRETSDLIIFKKKL
tara:strand:+ start:353 stop:1024 length:672 start_codon:yes stop_codon:yes gene_type:complete